MMKLLFRQSQKHSSVLYDRKALLQNRILIDRLSFKLTPVQIGVESISDEQFFMTALFDDMPVFHD